MLLVCMLADSALIYNNLEYFEFNRAGQPVCVYGVPPYR